jgi:hypothetical protein
MKLVWLVILIGALFILVGGVGSAVGAPLLVPVLLGAGVGLWAGAQKKHSGMLLIMLLAGGVVVFGLLVKTGVVK